LPYYTRELIGYSVQQRRLDLVTITSPKNLTSEEKCKVVFVTARVHPGETPSSYVCQGMMDYLVCNEPSAEVLRDNIIFKIAPMLNPDGVYLGNYRCSLMGFDLNRHWHDPSPWAHPTLTAAKQLLSQYDQDPNTDLVFYIDIHSHSTLTNGFMYGNIYEDADRRERHALFPKLFSSIADDFSLAQTSFNQDPAKAGTGRRFLGNNLDSGTNCYTLEVSFFSYQSMSSNVKVPYDEQAYLKLGRNLARTLISYYDLESLVERKEKEKLTSQS
jgi:murein tripeptide amidase MpaA